MTLVGLQPPIAIALDRCVGYYNGVRPHLGIGGRIPLARLAEKQAA